MSLTHTYTVKLDWQTDRLGTLSSPELDLKVDVATPPPFPKGMERIWSPEHLFTAAISSCLMTTFLAIAENSKLEFESFSCEADGILGQEEGKYKMTEIVLRPQLLIKREEDRARAERILQKAEAACLITNSITSKVRMQAEIETAILT